MAVDPSARTPGLSKSRFVAGSQCSKLLWLKTHEKDAPELAISPRLQDIFDQGNEVGALARQQFPGGVLVDLPHLDPDREPATRRHLAAGVPAVFEASFIAERTFVAIDVLERLGDGFGLIEVKSGVEARDKYVLDAALQAWVARKAGITITRIEIMHLSRDYIHGGSAPLLVRTDVTAEAEALMADIPGQIAAQLAVLAGPQPDVPIGQQCREPYECAFMGRCWPDQHDGVLKIHALKFDKRFEAFHGGIPSIKALPATFKLNAVQQRQRRSIETGSLVVEPGLREALAPFRGGTIGFLDFETVSRAVPRWSGTKPWQQIGVQFSYHESDAAGVTVHKAEFIAEPDTDPRRAIAERLLAATQHADRIAMYTPFERTQVRMMQEFSPELAEALKTLEAKLIDLKSVVHHNVYDAHFGGSFSIKDVLPVLVPGASYKDTVTIVDGSEASAKLARLLFYVGELTLEERDNLRRELLAYCKYDTYAMVLLRDRLAELAGA